MSTLARELAQEMADGRRGCLPRLTRDASPEFARDLLDAFYRLRDTLADDRASSGASWSLRDRIAAASVAQEIESAIDDACTWLRRTARRGGRGVLSPGCRGGTPAVMAHGRAALVPAVGPAPTVSQSHATASPADPLLLGLSMQELPVAGPSLSADIISTEGANL